MAVIMTHLQMSFISLGTISSLSSKGIMAKPPAAYSKPPKDTRFIELRSWGNTTKSDHLKNVNAHTEVQISKVKEKVKEGLRMVVILMCFPRNCFTMIINVTM